MKAKALRVVLVVVILASVAIAAFSATSSLSSSGFKLEEFERILPEGEAVAVKTEVKGNAFHLGDAITYQIIAQYNPYLVDLDKESLDATVDFTPFEERSMKEKDFRLDSETRVYLREYEIQLIDGETNELYSFPPAILKYLIKHFHNVEGVVVELQPIFISPRFPEDLSSFGLKPLAGKVKDARYENLPWVFWGLGIAFGVLVFPLIILKLKKWRESSKGSRQKKKAFERFFSIYHQLSEKALAGENPTGFLHQLYQTLRQLLSEQEGTDWLKPQLENISPAIKDRVFALQEKCQNAYRLQPRRVEEMDKALKDFKEILEFYSGEILNEGEV